jgi:hypothetical protein
MGNTILIIGSGYQEFRQYVLEGVAARCDVLLLNGGHVDWQADYALDHRTADLTDPEAVRAAVAELTAGRTVDGVVTWEEKLLPISARIGTELGVPAIPEQAARACRDKALQRAAFARHAVPSAAHRLAGTVEEALRAAAEIGFPVVVKPRGQAASIGVRVAHTPEELTEALARAQQAEFGSVTDGQVLVEEYLEGEEISVDSWVLDGEVRPYAYARKRTGFPPFFEEVGHIAGPVLDPGAEARVRAVVARANRALGVDGCVTHTELRLTPEGPRVVEVNGRLGGDLIPYLAQLATPGLSVGEMIADVTRRVRPRPVAAPDRCAGIRFLYPAQDLLLTDLEVAAEIAEEPWLHSVRRVRGSGSLLRLPPREFLGRAGYGIVLAEDVATADARLAVVAAGTRVLGEPADEPAAEREAALCTG